MCVISIMIGLIALLPAHHARLVFPWIEYEGMRSHRFEPYYLLMIQDTEFIPYLMDEILPLKTMPTIPGCIVLKVVDRIKEYIPEELLRILDVDLMIG